jgi:hypothetical protein
MKTTLKNNSVSLGYYLIVAGILITSFLLTISSICQILDWLSASAPSFLTASK